MTIAIYHNPASCTSRNTLALIRQNGEESIIIKCLKSPPTRQRFGELIAAMRFPVWLLLREKDTPYAALSLADRKWTDEKLIDFMIVHSILINQSIDETPKRVRLCRPSERVLEILPNPRIGLFTKEDGFIINGQ